MIRILSILFSIAVVHLATAQSGSVSPYSSAGLGERNFNGTQASRIYGQVLDINTNQLISDAQIMLVEEDSILGSSGTFKYVNNAGDYTLQITAPGYPVLDTIITMMEGDSLNTTYFLGTTTHTHSISKESMIIPLLIWRYQITRPRLMPYQPYKTLAIPQAMQLQL